jgi:8-oxo-dGTP diphosphatase
LTGLSALYPEGMGKNGSGEVKAAGGVVVKQCKKGPKIILVHRPSYDDWSLPKGKLDEGESFEQGALREVEEETGLVCELGRELSPVRYHDKKGRPKVVRYWQMTPLSGDFKKNDEVDEIRWVSPAKAGKALDYEHDRLLVAELFDED